MNQTTAGVVNYAPEPDSVESREVEMPSIGDDDVWLEVKGGGVGGSDLRQFAGQQSWKARIWQATVAEDEAPASSAAR